MTFLILQQNFVLVCLMQWQIQGDERLPPPSYSHLACRTAPHEIPGSAPVINFGTVLYLVLKLPSLVTAWLFWTFRNKSHNMTVLVILSHSWSPFLPLTCLYGQKWTSGSLCSLLEYFHEKKNSPAPRLPLQITWPWQPVSTFGHGLITVRQKKMWTWGC